MLLHTECIASSTSTVGCLNGGTVSTSQLPTRLIDVLTDTSDTSRVCLREVESVLPDTSNTGYVALSYRWGGPQHLILQKSFLPRLLCALALSKLPLGLQHAILLARRLGYRFLWIDALCILQDDNEDNQRNLQNASVLSQRRHLYITIGHELSVRGILRRCKSPPVELEFESTVCLSPRAVVHKSPG